MRAKESYFLKVMKSEKEGEGRASKSDPNSAWSLPLWGSQNDQILVFTVSWLVFFFFFFWCTQSDLSKEISGWSKRDVKSHKHLPGVISGITKALEAICKECRQPIWRMFCQWNCLQWRPCYTSSEWEGVLVTASGPFPRLVEFACSCSHIKEKNTGF